MNTFSQVVQATLASVRAQMVSSGTSHASTNLIVRHAMKHAESAEPAILAPVCEAVRDELRYSALRASNTNISRKRT